MINKIIPKIPNISDKLNFAFLFILSISNRLFPINLIIMF